MTAKPHPVRIWKFDSNENTPYFGIKTTAENMTCDVREEKGQLPSRWCTQYIVYESYGSVNSTIKWSIRPWKSIRLLEVELQTWQRAVGKMAVLHCMMVVNFDQLNDFAWRVAAVVAEGYRKLLFFVQQYIDWLISCITNSWRCGNFTEYEDMWRFRCLCFGEQMLQIGWFEQSGPFSRCWWRETVKLSFVSWR